MYGTEYLIFLQKEIHTTVAATVDDKGIPVTCAIDMMDVDEKGLYFLTAKGKSFYRRLKQYGNIALTGMKGKDTISCVSVSIQGEVREIGSDMVLSLFEKNPYMYRIYPTEESRKALTVFQIYKGSGEWFDLSKKPIERISFTFGDATEKKAGYYITKGCTGCRSCMKVCPQNCIDFAAIPAVIRQENCLHCGNCIDICPQNAVIREE